MSGLRLAEAAQGMGFEKPFIDINSPSHLSPEGGFTFFRFSVTHFHNTPLTEKSHMMQSPKVYVGTDDNVVV